MNVLAVISCALLNFQIVSDTTSDTRKTYSDVKDACLAEGKLLGSPGPENVAWIDDGEKYSFTKESAEHQEIYVYDPKTKESKQVFVSSDYVFPGREEAFQYESFQWSSGEDYLLFQANFRSIWRKSGLSDFYVFSLTTQKLLPVAKDARTAEISPDGSKVAYEKGGNLFVYDLTDLQEKQLTFDGADQLYNGRFGWAYEEEFGLPKAWEWSPDGTSIAYWQTDESDVPLFQMTDYEGVHAKYKQIPYPKPGDENPHVRVGVVQLATAETHWMQVPVGDGYIPRIYWTGENGQLAIVHLNRKQNQLKLYMSDVSSGESKLVMEEASDQWIDVFYYTGGMHYFFFPTDKNEFFWISDRDGWNHIYRYDYDGNLLNQVTQGAWEVLKIEGIDYAKNKIYYKSTETSPLNYELYSIGLDGKRKKRLTTIDGVHDINMSPNCGYYLDSYSSFEQPTQVNLAHTSKGIITRLETNVEVTQYVQEHFYAYKEAFRFTTEDGQPIDGYLIKPRNFDPEKQYPLILNIYGGPGAQFVINAFATDIWEQYAAQEGFVIANINNRGSGGYGRDFKKIVYRQLGKWQSYDFVQAAQYLGSLPWVDGEHMAIMGRSFGGFSSSYTMLAHPGVFKVALVAAAVVDWRLYDAIYTERYMDLPADNPEGYERYSSLSLAANLKDHMLIAHAAMDDNVHLQNAMQLLTRLIENGKNADLKIYPKGGHKVGYDAISQSLLYAQYMDYLKLYLMGKESRGK